MQDFKHLEVWGVAHRLTLAVYRATAAFPPDERYSLTSQMRRASASIPSNIAEGCGRGSDADFARFLHHAMGSASELEYQILLAHDLDYLTDLAAEALTVEAARTKRMLASLLKRLKADSQ
jgi:four helix bundle protein